MQYPMSFKFSERILLTIQRFPMFSESWFWTSKIFIATMQHCRILTKTKNSHCFRKSLVEIFQSKKSKFREHRESLNRLKKTPWKLRDHRILRLGSSILNEFPGQNKKHIRLDRILLSLDWNSVCIMKSLESAQRASPLITEGGGGFLERFQVVQLLSNLCIDHIDGFEP